MVFGIVFLNRQAIFEGVRTLFVAALLGFRCIFFRHSSLFGIWYRKFLWLYGIVFLTPQKRGGWDVLYGSAPGLWGIFLNALVAHALP